MPWVRLDDGFADHPKIMAAGPMASWLYVCGLTYAARMLTDGFIPASQVRKLADLDNTLALTERLAEVGLWKPVDGGFLINDYLEYNPSADKVRAERKAAQERMHKIRSGDVRANNLRSSPEVQLPRTHPVPVTPVPVQIPSEECADAHDAPEALERESYTTVFEAFWSEYPRGHGSKLKTFAAWKKVPARDRDAVMSGLMAWKDCGRWRRGVIVAADRWLREGRWNDPPPDDDEFTKPQNGRATAQDFLDLIHDTRGEKDANAPPGHAETVIDAAYSVSDGQALGAGGQRHR
jgi:hypothetical protein